MSEYGDFDGGQEPGGVDYGHFETGQESGALDQLHQASGGERDYESQFGVYGEDHSAAESTDFQTGQHVEFEGADGSRYESTDFTNYSNDSQTSDSVFAAEGGESAHSADFSRLDALQARFGGAFAEGTQLSAGPGDSGLSIASS
ncbi:hypothetical protein ACQP1P_26985 [Dactylosporangium sp. CA-052675]|uniref:hypothetical protein n=1 Tax=Dactylosporangium sp. CA-052675 TaxID=3239927 RepID=UPI003D935AEF